MLFLIFYIFAHAKGTTAGSVISNQAYMTFAMHSSDNNLSSNIDRFVIDHIVDMDLLWQDTRSVPVGGGYKDAMLRFVLVNLGNGDDNFTIAYEHNLTDSFDPAPENARFYLDADGDNLLDKSIDTLISGDINLSADTNATLFLLTDIVEGNYSANDLSYDGVRSSSTSTDTNGSDNKELVDTTVRTGSLVAMGIYEIKDFWLESNMTMEIMSEDNLTHTGTVLRYTILAEIGGETYHRQIDDLLIIDEIPKGSRYMGDSLYLDDKLLTDINDSDEGEVNTTHIRVRAGTLRDDENISIRFDVRVE